MAKSHDIPVRRYVSTIIECPYEGSIEPSKVAKVVEKMLDLGCYEISLGDTIGVGTPRSIRSMLDEMLLAAKPNQLAMHCHDTYGQALSNILIGLEKDITSIDSSVAGLGGCPCAKGASGNVAFGKCCHRRCYVYVVWHGLDDWYSFRQVRPGRRFCLQSLESTAKSK